MKRAAVAAVITAMLLASQAQAGTLTGAATEWTQIANNVALLESYVKEVESAKNTLESAAALKQQLRQLDPGTLASLSSGSLAEVDKLAALDKQMGDTVQASNSAVATLRTAMSRGMQNNMSPDQYLTYMTQLAHDRGGVYAKSLANDTKNLQNAQNQIADLKRTSAAAGSVTSNIQGFQQMLASGTRVQSQLISLNSNVAHTNQLIAMQAQDAEAEKARKAENSQKWNADRQAALKQATDGDWSTGNPYDYVPGGSGSGSHL